jgi:SAM-dependent methyltransferase
MAAISDVNSASLAAESSVDAYATREGLEAVERVVLDLVLDEIRERPILDLGVGGGRTTPWLRAISADYLAIDYTPEMVAACRARYPDADVRLGDARDLSALPRDHFAFVLFSCNGIGMLGHADRLRVLAEVLRVLAPGGVFAFSTHNLDSPDNHRAFVLPELELSLNPLRNAVRGLRFARRTVTRAVNRLKHKRHEEHHGSWSLLNSPCLDYDTLLYHVTLAEARRQLLDAGYAPTVRAFDHRGVEIERTISDDSIFFLARRP